MGDAIVIDFAAAKRRVAAAKLKRATRDDKCHVCGRALDPRERSAIDVEGGTINHMDCWLLSLGVKP